MSKTRLRRALAGAFGAILAFAMAATAFAATTPGVEVVSEPSTVTVHVYNNNNNPTDVEGTGNEVPDASTTLGTAIEGATLSYYKVGELVQYTANGKTSLKYAVKEEAVEFLGLNVPSVSSVTIGSDSYYLCDAAGLQDIIANKTSSGIRAEAQDPQTPIVNLEDTNPTDEQGAVSVSGLSGIFLFIGNTMPSQVTTEVAPFFVSAPMPADGGWNTDIHVYPKVQTAGEITVLKEVRYASSQDEDDFTQSMSADSGTPLEYRVTVTIPGDVKNLSSFSITDGLDNSLAVYDAGNVEVKTAGVVQLAESDYKLQVEAAAIRFELTSDGLNKFSAIHGDPTTITITYETEIETNAPLATAIGRQAFLSYRFKSSQQQINVQSTATVYAYGIDLTKTFEGAAEYPDGAQFSLYTDQDCQDAVAVSGGNGVYWLDSSGTNSMAVAQLSGTADGTLTMKGLAAGTYYLKEVAAPTGYGKLQEPIKIVVSEGTTFDSLEDKIQNPTATVNDVSAIIASYGNDKAGLVQLSVENQKLLFGFLPQTGDAGTLIATAAGIGMIALAIIFVAGRRSKSSAR